MRQTKPQAWVSTVDIGECLFRTIKMKKTSYFGFFYLKLYFTVTINDHPAPFNWLLSKVLLSHVFFLLKSCPEDIVLGNTVSRHLISLVAEHLLSVRKSLHIHKIYTQKIIFYVISKTLKLGQADYFCLGSYRQFTTFAYSTSQFWANPRCLDKNCDSVKQQSSSTLVKLWACFLGITYAWEINMFLFTSQLCNQ